MGRFERQGRYGEQSEPRAGMMSFMDPATWSVILSAAAFLVSVGAAFFTVRQRKRQEAAAVTTDLHPVLRQLRDSAWQWAKPLGGKGPDHVIAVHNGLIDLVDPTPAIADRTLARRCQELLDHDVAGIALSIDPPRFNNMTGSEEIRKLFADFGQRAHQAVERCQRLRRGTA